MIYGCVCTNGKYTFGDGFQFVCKSQSYTVGSAYGWYTTAYCSELGCYYGTTTINGNWAIQRSPGSVFTLSEGTVKTGTSGTVVSYTISSASFARITIKNHGTASGSISGTSYGGYYKVGDTITITSTGAQKIETSSGDSSTTGTLQLTVGEDLTVHCYKYSSPSVSASECKVGNATAATYTITDNGTAKATNASSASFSTEEGHTIAITITPNEGYSLDTVTLDGTSYTGLSSKSAMTFNIVTELREKSIYAISCACSARAGLTDKIYRTIHGSNELVPVVKNMTNGGSGTSVSLTASTDYYSFTAYVGDTYSISYESCEEEVGYSFDGIKSSLTTTDFRTSDDVATEDRTLTFIQGSAAAGFEAKTSARAYFTIPTCAVGTSTAAYGSSCSAYTAGCRATITTSGTDTVWYSSHDFTVTGTAVTGWSFIGCYAVKADGTVIGYAASSDGTATISITAACTVIAIFGDPTATESDADQGNASTASSITGLFAWEKGATNKTITWKSKRYVCDRPLNLSCAQVYADEYPVVMKVHLFESPESTDGRVSQVSVASQNSIRLPMRRPSKYIEIELQNDAQTTGVSVSTAMEGLWH